RGGWVRRPRRRSVARRGSTAAPSGVLEISRVVSGEARKPAPFSNSSARSTSASSSARCARMASAAARASRSWLRRKRSTLATKRSSRSGSACASWLVAQSVAVGFRSAWTARAASASPARLSAAARASRSRVKALSGTAYSSSTTFAGASAMGVSLPGGPIEERPRGHIGASHLQPNDAARFQLEARETAGRDGRDLQPDADAGTQGLLDPPGAVDAAVHLHQHPHLVELAVAEHLDLEFLDREAAHHGLDR